MYSQAEPSGIFLEKPVDPPNYSFAGGDTTPWLIGGALLIVAIAAVIVTVTRLSRRR